MLRFLTALSLLFAPVPALAQPDLPFIGSVSAADPRAEAAGMEILRAGGSATDAAIAVMLALTVVEPQSSGIGGGGFYVRGDAAGAVESLDGRETAPAGATPDWFYENGTLPPFGQSVQSGLSVGVPGNIALAAEAHRRHGRLPWARLFAPAIALADDGFAINRRLADYLVNLPDRAGAADAARAIFYAADGRPLPAGTQVRNPALAATLRRVAQGGAQAFYRGETAEAIAREVAAATPRERPMTVADLAAYQAQPRDAVCGRYRGYRICGMGPPSSGGVAVIQMLGQLERFDLAASGVGNPLTWHLFAESQRLAYADRELYLADSDFVAVPVAGLIDPAYLAARSRLIRPDARLETVEAGRPTSAQARADGDEPEENGTSHLAVVDAAGTMVSYTSTIEGPFGSGLMTGGFYLNNELTDFSRAPEQDGVPVANRVEGGKRPRSSMAPTVVWDPDGRPVMVVGAAGGSTIPVQTARAIIGVIDFGLSARQALGLPFVMTRGNRLMIEEGSWLERAAPAFTALGWEVSGTAPPLKGGAILRADPVWEAARDPRLATELVIP